MKKPRVSRGRFSTLGRAGAASIIRRIRSMPSRTRSRVGAVRGIPGAYAEQPPARYANMCSMTSQGSAYSRFQRALKTGNLTLIRNAAAELPRVDLGDALAVCVAIHAAERERYERAALRWLARYCLERREATLAHVQTAAWAFENLADEQGALETLERLCSR